MAIIFDGINEKYGYYPNESLIHRDIDQTMAMWVMPDADVVTNQWIGGMDGGSSTGIFRASGFYYRGDQPTKPISLFKASSSVHYNIGVPIPGQWNMVVESRLSSGGSSVTTATKMAVNGTDSTQNTLINTNTDIIRFIVGSLRNVGSTPQYTERFKGKVWGWAIWSRVLTDQEIDSLQTGANPNTISGLIVLHSFQTAGTGTTSVSQIGNKTMTFVGSPALDSDTPFPSYAINSINNGTNQANISATVSIDITGFSSSLTSGTIDGIALSSVSDASISLPSLIDGQQIPRTGTRTLSLTNGSESSTKTITVSAPSGLTEVKIGIDFFTGIDNSIIYQFNPAVVLGDSIFYDSTKGTVGTDASYESDLSGIQQFWHYQLSTKIVRSFDVMIGGVIGFSCYPNGTGGGTSLNPDNIRSGGTSAFRWTAPEGLYDGKTITISSDTHNFIPPTGYVYLGFGKGWLYENNDGLGLTDLVIPTATGNQVLDYEYSQPSANRKIFTIGTKKFLRSELYYPTSGNQFNAGFINWDTGSNLAPGEFLYQFNTSKLTKNVGAQTNFQWKGSRNAQYANLPSGDEANANSIYLKLFSGGLIIDAYKGAPSNSTEYYCNDSAPSRDGELFNLGWSSVQNTPDATDGFNGVHSSKGTKSYTRDVPISGFPTYLLANDTTLSTFATRTRFAKIQDYIGNVTDASEIEILRTDIFMQRNGSIFILANNTNLTNATQFIPLVPLVIESNSWQFNLWKGEISDFTGCAIFMLDKYLTIQASVNL